jgi:hypothetical protein
MTRLRWVLVPVVISICQDVGVTYRCTKGVQDLSHCRTLKSFNFKLNFKLSLTSDQTHGR